MADERGLSRPPLSRRSFLEGLGVSALGLGLAGCGGSTLDDERPNIVILVLDSLRAKSLPMYGHSRNTAPFLAELATRSTLFERCYSAATWTRPSVTSILTGLPPLEHRGWRFNKAFPADRPSFARFLGESGYRTGFFTANPAIGKRFGMEEHFDHVSTDAANENDFGPRLTRDCIAWVNSLPDSRPVFVYTHYFPPHGPYDPPDEFLQRARKQAQPSARRLAHRYRDRAGISLASGILGWIPWYQAKLDLGADPLDYCMRYEANVAFADSLAEGFFTSWNKLQRRKGRTVFIVTSDHGEGLGEHDLLFDHGMVVIDEILHVPLLVHDTETPRPSRVKKPVSHLDLAPTVLELAQTPRSFGTLSESLLGERSEERTILSQEGVEKGESAWALTSDRWRLVYNGGARFGGRSLMHVHSADRAASTVTATAVSVPATVLRGPHEIVGEMVLESFAFHNQTLIRGSEVRFSGTLRATEADERLSLRARVPGSPPVDLGVFRPGDFEGEMAGVPNGQEEKPGFLIVEGGRRSGGDLDPQTGAWHRLLTIPVLSPQSLTEDLELLGGVMEPRRACPADAVRIDLFWRTYSNIRRGIGYLVELVGPRGEAAIREVRPFFGRPPGKEFELRPLIAKSSLEETTFSQGSLDFEDSFWWTLPSGLEPGAYELRVGLLNYENFVSTKEVVELTDAIPTTTIKIVKTRSECLRLNNLRELGIESLRVPPEFRPAASDRPVIEDLANRFPGQGHLDYLLGIVARNEATRRALFSRCIEKTPFHNSALTELASLGDEDSAASLVQLTPSHRSSVRFADVIRLAGFDLCRGDACIYLTLYWDADAVSAALFSTNLATTMRLNSGETSKQWRWWFIGGAQRPTHRWKLGERVVETVRLEIEPDTASLSFELALAERWRLLASNSRGRFPVTAGTGEERATIWADLGTHRLDHLPRCEVDHLAVKRSDPDQCVLFDLDGDPEQLRDLKLDRPDIFSRLHEQLGSLLAASDSWGQQQQGTEVELSRETIEQLKAIGYLDQEDDQ